MSIDQLKKAAAFKLEMTNLSLYDKFVIIAKAMGNSIDSPKKSSNKTNAESLPPASFDMLSSFLGPM